MNDFTQRERVRPGAIILVSATLISIGLIMVASATAGLDRPLLGPRVWTTTFGRQVIFALAGIAIMFITARIAPAALGSAFVRRRACQPLFVAAIVFRILVIRSVRNGPNASVDASPNRREATASSGTLLLRAVNANSAF